MRYGNHGEGGIMALTSMIKGSHLSKNRKWLFVALGLVGASLFYGDGAITPAISVLSAAEGMKVITPHLSSLVLPLTLAVLVSLFWIQRYGTGVVGRLFGPIMLLWFASIAAAGVWQITKYPYALHALSPYSAIHFFITKPLLAFLAMSAVVLAITGAEALYADMGHFGRPPIAKAWFFIVFPALTLCYLGQGGMLLRGASLSNNLLIQMFPVSARIPEVILATLATIIASQSVISGVFSITRQAIQLDLLPKMLISYTSLKRIGQIYIPFINAVLLVLVAALVLIFKTSGNLANAYGIAVSGTLAADTILFLVVARNLRKKSRLYVSILCIAFLPLDLVFIASNLQKIPHGGLFPIVVGALVCIIMYTWNRGDTIVELKRKSMGESLQTFVNKVHSSKIPVRRVPGAAIYIGHHTDLAPLALTATIDDLHELPEKAIILTINITNSAHVHEEKRAVVDGLKYIEGISHISLFYGYHDTINIPKDIKPLVGSTSELGFNLSEASYFISSAKISANRRHNLAHWRKSLFLFMYRNALSASDYYHLPLERTQEMETLITL